MGRKRQRSPAQTKHMKDLTRLRRNRSHSDSDRRDALADARMNNRETNRLAKVAEKEAKKAIRNARKWELRALPSSPYLLVSLNVETTSVTGCPLLTTGTFHAVGNVWQLCLIFSAISVANAITPPIWKTPGHVQIQLTVHTRELSFMCHPSVIEKFGDPRNVIGEVHSLVTQQLTSLLDRPLTSNCGHCSGNHIQSTWTMAPLTWIWFKIPPGTHVSPSLTLAFDQFGEPRMFTLAAVVYLGRSHFTTCWRDHSGVWWKHDGRKHHGAPVVDTINYKSDLCQSDGHQMSILIYSFQHDT